MADSNDSSVDGERLSRNGPGKGEEFPFLVQLLNSSLKPKYFPEPKVLATCHEADATY